LPDLVLSAVQHLVREDGPFTSALAQTRDTSRAFALALETIEGDARPSSRPGEGAVGRLEMLLRTRLREGLKRGDMAVGLNIGDLSVFYANVAVSLVVETLSGGDQERLSAIRRVAMRVMTQSAIA
jgi:hypothetical protein